MHCYDFLIMARNEIEHKKYCKKLDILISKIVDYLGIEEIPFEFSNEINDDSSLLLKPRIMIVISTKFIDNYYESA